MTAQLATELRDVLATKLCEQVNPRSPAGLDTALETTCRQEERNIWLAAGFQAWYAWFCSDNDTKAALARLPESDLQEIAQSVCSLPPDDTVQTLFEHLFYKAFRGAWRRRLLEDCGYSYPASLVPSQTTSTGNITPARNKRRNNPTVTPANPPGIELASSGLIEPAYSRTPDALPQPYQQHPASTATHGYWHQQPAAIAPVAPVAPPPPAAPAAPAAPTHNMPNNLNISLPGRFTAAEARRTARVLRSIAQTLDDAADELED